MVNYHNYTLYRPVVYPRLRTAFGTICHQLSTVESIIVVIYHHPLVGVILMVILHIFIIKNYPIFFSNYYPKYTFWVIYPFLMNLGEFIYEVTSHEHNPIVRVEMAMFSFFGILFLIDTMSGETTTQGHRRYREEGTV